jgi:putative ABC transport system permease protein
MLRNYLKLTLKVLRRKRVYTAVTLAGIVIPVTFIVLVTSFLVQIDNYRSPRSNFRKVFFLDNLIWEEVREDSSVNQHNENPPNLWFVQRYVKTMETPKLVSVVSNSFERNNERIYHGTSMTDASVLYTDDVFWQITDFRFLSGRPYNLAEYEQGARVVVIDRKTSMDVFGTIDAAGEGIRIKNRLFRVTGVVENTDITMYRITANLYLPYSCLESFHSDYFYSNFSRALLLADGRNDFDIMNREFKQKLKYVTFDNTGDINRIDGTLVRDSYLKRIEALAATYFHYHKGIKKPLYLAGFLLLFLFIILPAINLVNININRVFERLSEIGVRKTFGATIRKLTGQFLFENVVITIAGGILSILLSAVIISILNRTDALGGVYLQLNYAGFGISLAAILVIGVLSGILPSITMARARIVECLNSSE